MRNLATSGHLQFVVAAAAGLSREDFAPLFSAGVPFKLVADETYNALAAADCAIVSSGTATVEAALLGAPMVVVYRLSAFTAALARWLVHTRTFAMVNLIAGRKIVPELIQNDFTSARVAAEVRRLLEDPAAVREMKSHLAEIRTRLGSGGAIERAAEAIARLLAEKPSGNPADIRAI
jgi:lipid-A-disaccharide synthase